MTGRTAKPKPTKTLEQRLWEAGDKLRGRRLLAKFDYPPDAEPKVIELVLEQAEVLAREQTA